MKNIKIYKNSILTNEATFPDEMSAQIWLQSHLEMGTFGKSAVYGEVEVLVSPEVRGEVPVIIKEAELDEYGDELTPALIVIDPDGVVKPAVWKTVNQLITPAEFEIDGPRDISDEVEQERINTEALAYLASSDWKVLRHIRELALGQLTTLSSEEYRDLESSRSQKADSIKK